jgi:hypothetical protein
LARRDRSAGGKNGYRTQFTRMLRHLDPSHVAGVVLRLRPATRSAGRQSIASLSGGSHRQIVDARFAPYSAIGKFKGAMICTAAIVLDPRIIVTAAHCIMERDGTIGRSNFSFQPGYQVGSNSANFDAAIWVVGSRQSVGHETLRDAAKDWAILASGPGTRVRSFILPLESHRSHDDGLQARAWCHSERTDANVRRRLSTRSVRSQHSRLMGAWLPEQRHEWRLWTTAA